MATTMNRSRCQSSGCLGVRGPNLAVPVTHKNDLLACNDDLQVYIGILPDLHLTCVTRHPSYAGLHLTDGALQPRNVSLQPFG